MKKIMKLIMLNKEAYLFDTWLYIIKSFVAVISAYVIVQQLPLVHKDLISVLFGLMMTLEPVTMTGIRSGLKQITATLLGAFVTAFIIFLFGINLFTVAISLSATLYVCLKINWREVSPVAIFTSIYMTNYIQYTSNGEPSIALTFLLRILSLGVGIVVAVIYNFIFSLFFYKQLERKRIAHSLNKLTELMIGIKEGIENNTVDTITHVKDQVSSTFKEIEWLSSLVKDKEKEDKLKKIIKLQSNQENTDDYHTILKSLSNITHLIYDTAYYLSNQWVNLNELQLNRVAFGLKDLIKECDYLAAHRGNDMNNYMVHQTEQDDYPQEDHRVAENLTEIKEMLMVIKHSLYH
jgi:uncharacterized membrane protein YgaE (UPF0421/DUF939 family)